MNNLKEPFRTGGWEFVLGFAVTVQNNLLNWILHGASDSKPASAQSPGLPAIRAKTHCPHSKRSVMTAKI
jgi:hypothetical protein